MCAEAAVPVIAIDGPSGAGKGTVAREVAARLGFHYLDSGALYRAAALAGLEAGADLENASDIARIILKSGIKFSDGRAWIGARDVTEAIRDERIGEAASRIAALPPVREALLGIQRGMRRPPGLVAEGRDMGTVVFPDARLKIFLTASPEARAARRYKQLMEKGMRANMAALLQDIQARDARDSERATAPLRKSASAVVVDTTDMTVAAAVAQVLSLYRQAPLAP
jgi:cytidylate kinase